MLSGLRRTVIALAALPFVIPLPAQPGYGEPLSLTRGKTTTVKTVSELRRAINTATAPSTILISNGTYKLDGAVLHIRTNGLVIRSASGNRDKVIIRGPDEGPDATTPHVFLIPASDVVIADITLGHCRFHGIQVQGESPHDASGLHVHNCRLVNCNEQFIKGSSKPDDPIGATDGIIENCLFEFTSGWAYQYYTGGIDIHKGVNWIVRDNLFRNIRVPAGKNGMSEHAIHFWNRSSKPQNVVVERNQIINCDRGIGFGLINEKGGHNGGSSAIRNNFVYNDGTGPSTDVGIGLEHADHVAVENNTVWIAGYRGAIEHRFPTSSDLVFRNNLSNNPILPRNEPPPATLSHNIGTALPVWFTDIESGDLHLTNRATEAIDAGIRIEGVKTDIDGDPRPTNNSWDIGADEFRAEP